jgi:hypothetical protein
VDIHCPIYAEREDEPHVENLVQIQGWNGEQRAYSNMERRN